MIKMQESKINDCRAMNMFNIIIGPQILRKILLKECINNSQEKMKNNRKVNRNL